VGREVTLAATQMSCGRDIEENVAKAERLVRDAARGGANIVLLQELFETPYFPIDQDAQCFDFARPLEGHPTIERMRSLAKDLAVVVPVSFFERANNAFFNSVAVIDASGSVLGIYRKTHIPQAPAYQEKYFFSPGTTGFRVWNTRFGVLGVGICWDQWFPESARCMALMGAEVLLYPTAIGSDPPGEKAASREQWQRVQQGHAAANFVPLVASNRVGTEEGRATRIRFYGSSFITDQTGAKVAEASEEQEEIVTAAFDLDETRRYRDRWAIFRDRRPDMYRALLTADGSWWLKGS
jgi:N-carbamoylputrescine amidase